MKHTIKGLGTDLKGTIQWFKDPYITINIDWKLRKRRPFQNENTDGDYKEPPAKEWQSGEAPPVCSNTRPNESEDRFQNA